MLGYNLTSHRYRYYVIVISAGIKILKNPQEMCKIHGFFSIFIPALITIT